MLLKKCRNHKGSGIAYTTSLVFNDARILTGLLLSGCAGVQNAPGRSGKVRTCSCRRNAPMGADRLSTHFRSSQLVPRLRVLSSPATYDFLSTAAETAD